MGPGTITGNTSTILTAASAHPVAGHMWLALAAQLAAVVAAQQLCQPWHGLRDLARGGHSDPACSIKTDLGEYEVCAQDSFLSDRAGFGTGIEVEFSGKQRTRERIDRVATLLSCDAVPFEQGQRLVAGTDTIASELDAGICDQIVEKDPPGVSPTVGGSDVSSVVWSARVPHRPIGDRARIALSRRDAGLVGQARERIALCPARSA
jgi:hypothetical protein